MACDNVGETNPDIAGLGIIIAFAFQAGLSLILSIWSSFLGMGFYRDEDFDRKHPSLILKEILDRILKVISDVQVLNALGLLIATLIQSRTLSLYHLHVIYDTVNFTAVSMCGSLVNVASQGRERRRTRLASLLIFMCLYISYTGVFLSKLVRWDAKNMGRCYDSSLITLSSKNHPRDDIIYVAITCFYCLLSLGTCASANLSTRDTRLMSTEALNLVITAMLQYPLHFYMVITIRSKNESLLQGDSENTWGFGQIFALVTTAATVVECVLGIYDYRKRVNSDEVDERSGIRLGTYID